MNPAGGRAGLAQRPRLRGASHAVAALAAIPAGAWLIDRAPTASSRAASVIYVVTMTAMFAVSGAYHLGHWSARSLRLLKAADHVAIFCFIAGSYGPLGVLTLSERAGTGWLGLLWIGALAGCVIKVRGLDRLGGPADALYGLLSGSALLLLPALVTRLEAPELGLLLAGLACYGLGSLALITQRPDPRPATFGYHEWAHLWVVGGVLSHFLLYAILFR